MTLTAAGGTLTAVGGTLVGLTGAPPVPSGPPTFRSASYLRSTSGTSLAVTTPADTQDGDVLIAFVGTVQGQAAGVGTVSAPDGWTEQFQVPAPDGFNAPGIACFTKTAASEGPTTTFMLAVSKTATVTLLAYSAALLDAPGSRAAAFSGDVAVNGVTASSDDAVWIAATMAHHQNLTVSDGAAGGWATRFTSPAATNVWQRVSDKPIPAGATGNDTASFDLINSSAVKTSDWWISGSVVLKPKATPTPEPEAGPFDSTAFDSAVFHA